MSSQSTQIAAADERHEELFLARYSAMRGWALGLTEGDRARAEDLLHDAFVHFTAARPDLSRVENLDGYLYVMLRNLNTSQLRRSARLAERALPVTEYDSAELSLRATDPRAVARVQDELRHVCRYACVRKETSKAGSVLILRFFHGYYPREIAQVVKNSREAVEERLRVARGEARQFLKDPSSLRFMRGGRADDFRHAPAGIAQGQEELLTDLRRMIFDSGRGECPGPAGLSAVYGDEPSAGGVETKTLAHVVSCPRCIDDVNQLLGLAPLDERFPTDATVREASPKGKDGDGGGGGGASAGGATEDEITRCRRRAREVFEHKPQELCVAVNGRVLGAQRASGARCEQRLAVTLAEELEFVEVFSEQEVRLLFLEVGGRRARGAEPLSARASLSDERRVEATINLDGPWPMVEVVYEDSRLAAESAPQAMSSPHSLRAAATAAGVGEDSGAGGGATAAGLRPARNLPALAAKLSGWLAGTRLFMKPAALTAALALLVAGALIFTRLHVPAVSAAELLKRSALAEDQAAADVGSVVHRTFHVEGSAGKGAQTARQRVEVWQSAARGLKLRRVYDREGLLVAGEWERADGVRTVYVRGEAAREETVAPDAGALLDAGEAWRLDLSAKTFSALVGDAAGGVAVDEKLGSYVLDYRRAAGDGALAGASLRLSKSDLRATAQTLVVRSGGAEREYRFFEGGFERLAADAVAPTVFTPDAELIGGKSGRAEPGGVGGERGSAPSPAASDEANAPAVASPELEVEVAYRLSRIKADLGEQVTWARTTGGQLRVEAITETEERKGEILRALGPVAGNPAVIIDVGTVAEKLRRAQSPGGAESVREVEVRTGLMPADADLRRHLAARGVGDEQMEGSMRNLAARAMSRSRQALLHASALKRLAARFTPEQVNALAPEARAKWLAVVREHAQSLGRELRALDGELSPVFPHASGPGVSADAADPVRAADRLVALSYANDEAVRSAFTASSDAGRPLRVKSPQFWLSLREAGVLASSILEAYEK